jgi:hypothetical protein
MSGSILPRADRFDEVRRLSLECADTPSFMITSVGDLFCMVATKGQKTSMPLQRTRHEIYDANWLPMMAECPQSCTPGCPQSGIPKHLCNPTVFWPWPTPSCAPTKPK